MALGLLNEPVGGMRLQSVCEKEFWHCEQTFLYAVVGWVERGVGAGTGTISVPWTPAQHVMCMCEGDMSDVHKVKCQLRAHVVRICGTTTFSLQFNDGRVSMTLLSRKMCHTHGKLTRHWCVVKREGERVWKEDRCSTCHVRGRVDRTRNEAGV